MKIGLIGTGLMGLPMAHRLLAVGESVMVYNRTPEKLEALKPTSAEIGESAAAVLRDCQAIILMLTNAQAIREVVLSEETRPLLNGRTLIQMGTISPSDSRALSDEITAAAGHYLEAPVLGSIPEVKAGTLLVMVGASVEQFEQWRSLLQHFGSNPLRVGEVGAAAALKLALNQLIASLTTGFALSLGFIQQQGVEVETFMQLLRQSALYAPTFDKKLQRLVEGNYENPNFPTRHLLKDTNLFLQEAIASGLQVDSLNGVRHILELAIQLGWADADYSALFAAIQPQPPAQQELS